MFRRLDATDAFFLYFFRCHDYFDFSLSFVLMIRYRRLLLRCRHYFLRYVAAAFAIFFDCCQRSCHATLAAFFAAALIFQYLMKAYACFILRSIRHDAYFRYTIIFRRLFSAFAAIAFDYAILMPCRHYFALTPAFRRC